MPKPREYKKGEQVGEYGITFIEEVSPYISPKGRKTRRAIFKCGLCGTDFTTTIPNVVNGATKSCGCLAAKIMREKAAKRFIGKRFGKLVVVDQVIIDNSVMYKCHCDCGNDTIVKGGNLTSGNTRSCGCLEKEILDAKYFTDLTGQSFGKLTVLYYLGKDNGERIWECMCECGNTVVRTQSTILSGNSSCGCQTSVGETKISKMLQDKRVKFLREYTFSECLNPKTNRKLRFDFYLPEYNAAIEIDGRQHFIANGSFAELEGLDNIQYRDRIKSDYCVNHNITLIRIPYTRLDSVDIESILTIIKNNKEHFMISYNPMIVRMLNAFEQYDSKREKNV